MTKLAGILIFFAAVFLALWFFPLLPIREHNDYAPGGLPCGLKNDPVWQYIKCPPRFRLVFESGEGLYYEYLMKNPLPQE